MNGVHDIGGMHGFGPIEREADEPHFHAEWEAHISAIMEIALDRRYFTIDAARHGIERMEPAHYLRAPYFERWLASIERNLIQEGLLTDAELDARTEFIRRNPGADTPSGTSTPPPPKSHQAIPAPPEPRFAVGDRVVARNVHPVGHTRLPRYARGKRGMIHRLYGPQTFPDTNAHGLGEHPQPLYSVRFEARELWGDSAEPREVVYLDLWDSYLESATS
ncbi:MAG: nitrile hydratase subunit beta [Thermomicrobiales bacterium]|jgi:nitrile hydratase|nr:nitrile hydratase subunit beta [Thermomicrobiales bacterium]